MLAAIDLPAALAVANIHPDYIQTCVELGCTGSSRECRLEPGTITLVRQTAGGSTKRLYGVVGLWAYSGRCEQVGRRERMWPSRWDKKLVFEPLVRQFQAVWCEDFSLRPGAGSSGHNQSIHVPGLTFVALQGSVVRVRDAEVAAAYVDGLMKARQCELQVLVSYRGETLSAMEILEALRTKLRTSIPSSG